MIRSLQKKSLLGMLLVATICFAIAFTATYVFFHMSHSAYAAQKEDWKAGNIIDDSIFTDKDSMSVSDIQSFLDQKIGTCDIWGTGKATEYGSSQTRAQYAASRGWAGPPYTCLNRYYEVPKLSPGGDLPANNYSSPDTIPNGAQSAAWIIKDAATRYNISPRVLLVKIATESIGPLTSDNWPLFSQYRYAMGSHCPDSGPNGSANCDSNYAGFSIQIYSAAQLMRWYIDSMGQPWWSYKKPYQTNSIMWNVSERGCGSGNVYIENKATAALYTYTPYQPNQAALNNLYGTGDSCSAYGNRNFWRVYVDWFGSSTIQLAGDFKQKYDSTGGDSGPLGKVTGNKVCGLKDGGCFQGFEKGGLYWSPTTNGVFESYGDIRNTYVQLGAENGMLGYPNDAMICGLKDGGCFQSYEKGSIYYSPTYGSFESRSPMRSLYLSLGTERGVLGYPTSSMICGLKDGGCFQSYEKGSIYWSPRLGSYENYGEIRNTYLNYGTESGFLGYPTNSPTCNAIGCYQTFQGGSIYQESGKAAYTVRGGIYSIWDNNGKEWGKLGLPISDEIYGIKDHGSYQLFTNGAIYWTPNGGRVVMNMISNRWKELGSENGKMGYPKSDSVCNTRNNGCYQSFQDGNYIYWSPATGSKSIWGAIYTKWDEAGKEWGKLGYPTSNEYYSNGNAYQDFEGGMITWTSAQGAVVLYK